MIIGKAEIVTILVILLYLIPILWNIFKSEFYKTSSFVGLIKIFNESLKIQGIMAIGLLPISWTWNKLDFIFDYIIGDAVYTYIVIGIFMYLPSLAFLNFIKLLIENKMKNTKK